MTSDMPLLTVTLPGDPGTNEGLSPHSSWEKAMHGDGLGGPRRLMGPLQALGRVAGLRQVPPFLWAPEAHMTAGAGLLLSAASPNLRMEERLEL